ncbi:MAG: three-Cys-motif partner protein TcmP [Erysipelotrichaceae bacterium]
MSKNNNDFFKAKKEWSCVKDELLGCYLKPYFQKLLATKKDIIYIDCFAGKGIFEDGSKGSPIIALEIIKDCLSNSHQNGVKIEPYFIELNHSDELKQNLISYGLSDNNIVSGSYEDKVFEILSGRNDINVFLYIDPYGIKSLDYNFFNKLSCCKLINSIEILINFNSFGFVREACHAMGGKFDDYNIFQDLLEYEGTRLERNSKSEELLNRIAGGDYWKNTINKFKRKEITGKEAEVTFSKDFCIKLQLCFRYVLNMPLRIRQDHHPKYRMIHLTKHVEGCLIMADNIIKRWQLMINIQSGNQISFFKEDTENNIISGMTITEEVKNHIMQFDNFTRLNQILADFYMKNGVKYSTSDLKKELRNLEECRLIQVKRVPDTTPTGKQTKFYEEKGTKKVLIRWKL